VIHLLTGWNERLVLIGATLALIAFVLLCRFQWIERVFGLSGLLMIVLPFPQWSSTQIGAT